MAGARFSTIGFGAADATFFAVVFSGRTFLAALFFGAAASREAPLTLAFLAPALFGGNSFGAALLGVASFGAGSAGVVLPANGLRVARGVSSSFPGFAAPPAVLGPESERGLFCELFGEGAGDFFAATFTGEASLRGCARGLLVVAPVEGAARGLAAAFGAGAIFLDLVAIRNLSCLDGGGHQKTRDAMDRCQRGPSTRALFRSNSPGPRAGGAGRDRASVACASVRAPLANSSPGAGSAGPVHAKRRGERPFFLDLDQELRVEAKGEGIEALSRGEAGADRDRISEAIDSNP